MTTEEKFIKIMDININKPKQHEQYVDIYQIQAINNQPFASIIKVGNMVEPNDILIKKFTIYDNYTCFIISKLYSIEHIKELHNHKLFQMVKINICNDAGVICHLAFNFCPTGATSLLNNLEGYFSVTLHYDNKYTVLEELKTYCGNESMMIKLTEYLLSDKVQDVLKIA